jgi:hypothetical protein
VKGILATSDTTWEDFEVLEKEKEAEKEADKKKLRFGKLPEGKMGDRGGIGLKR